MYARITVLNKVKNVRKILYGEDPRNENLC
jgi:hypothetical protein